VSSDEESDSSDSDTEDDTPLSKLYGQISVGFILSFLFDKTECTTDQQNIKLCWEYTEKPLEGDKAKVCLPNTYILKKSNTYYISGYIFRHPLSNILFKEFMSPQMPKYLPVTKRHVCTDPCENTIKKLKLLCQRILHINEKYNMKHPIQLPNTYQQIIGNIPVSQLYEPVMIDGKIYFGKKGLSLSCCSKVLSIISNNTSIIRREMGCDIPLSAELLHGCISMSRSTKRRGIHWQQCKDGIRISHFQHTGSTNTLDCPNNLPKFLKDLFKFPTKQNIVKRFFHISWGTGKNLHSRFGYIDFKNKEIVLFDPWMKNVEKKKGKVGFNILLKICKMYNFKLQFQNHKADQGREGSCSAVALLRLSFMYLLGIQKGKEVNFTNKWRYVCLVARLLSLHEKESFKLKMIQTTDPQNNQLPTKKSISNSTTRERTAKVHLGCKPIHNGDRGLMGLKNHSLEFGIESSCFFHGLANCFYYIQLGGEGCIGKSTLTLMGGIKYVRGDINCPLEFLIVDESAWGKAANEHEAILKIPGLNDIYVVCSM
jgi:hypothetical protein